LNIVTTLSNNVLDELKKEGSNKSEIESIKSNIVSTYGTDELKESNDKS
jgi:hypothetical protein